MALENLLVYLDGSDRSEAVMEIAVRLAQRHEACLSGLHVVGFLLPNETGIGLTGAANPFPPSNSCPSNHLLIMAQEHGLARVCQGQKIFTEQSQKAGLRGDWHTAEGMVAYTAGMRARHFDLTIVGQVDPAHPPLGTRRLVPEALLLESGRPVLIIPYAGTFPTIGDNVLIGWDGSREAARAINDALPLLQKAQSVAVITLVRPSHYTSHVAPDPTLIATHLARHGIKATASKRTLREQTVAEALLDAVARKKADLLVMGGYGHPRLLEWVIGGTTQSILHDAKVPVFMAH